MMEVGNFIYFIVLAIEILLTVGLYLFLKNKSKNFTYNFLLIWCFCNFALHFLKQFSYMSFYSLRKSTAENICAVSTLVFPFIMLYKKQGSIHDFMFMIGVIGGGAGLLYPTEAIGKQVFAFDTLRFFFCHYSLFAIPLLLALTDIYRPKFKNFWKMPIYFLIYEAIICGNTALIIVSKLYKNDKNMTFIELFFDKNLLNNSFVFGPTDDMGKVGQIIGNLCPGFMKIDIFKLFNGRVVYWPVVWLIIPSIIIFIPLYLLISFPFYYKRKEKS